MNTYLLPHVEGIPDWNSIAPLPIAHQQWSDPTPIHGEARLCWSEDAIYVRLRAWETEIRAIHRGRPFAVCEDSCLEFFFQPLEGDPRYFNFEFNCNCALFLGFGSGIRDLTRLLVEDEAALFAPEAQRLPDGWEVTYRIPVSFIRRFFPEYTPHREMAFRANCYKCGDCTRQPHYLSWNPMTASAPDFHRSQDFGRMIFA